MTLLVGGMWLLGRSIHVLQSFIKYCQPLLKDTEVVYSACVHSWEFNFSNTFACISRSDSIFIISFIVCAPKCSAMCVWVCCAQFYTDSIPQGCYVVGCLLCLTSGSSACCCHLSSRVSVSPLFSDTSFSAIHTPKGKRTTVLLDICLQNF